jgi:VanZ family protein
LPGPGGLHAHSDCGLISALNLRAVCVEAFDLRAVNSPAPLSSHDILASFALGWITAILLKPANHERRAMALWKVIDAARRSGWTKAAGAFCVLLVFVGSLLPETERIPTGLPGQLEHFLAYGVTGLLLGLAISGRNAPILAAANLAIIACLLEFLQQWSTGRHPRVSDAVVSALAGMLGAGLSAWLRKGAQTRFVAAQRQDGK